ncbi:hypothetical protein [Pararhodobacter sp. SW119]|uniref:hypothetical protein n=1 Tax=Pararhodobacter sp. SW119 TaxID=2780075 RepID=UPI001AE024BD|nr:hypothetical protein [Pararhodobacter sp. SW119]
MSINHQMPQVAAYRDGLLEGHSSARDTGLRERTSGAARRSSDFGTQQVSDHFSLAAMGKEEALLRSDQAPPSTVGWTRTAGETRGFAIAHRNPFPCFAKTGAVSQSSWRSVPDPSAFYVNPRRIEPSENRRILLITTLDQRACAKFDAQTNASVSLSDRTDQPPPFGDHSLTKDIFALPRGISVRPNRGLIPLWIQSEEKKC